MQAGRCYADGIQAWQYERRVSRPVMVEAFMAGGRHEWQPAAFVSRVRQ